MCDVTSLCYTILYYPRRLPRCSKFPVWFACVAVRCAARHQHAAAEFRDSRHLAATALSRNRPHTKSKNISKNAIWISLMGKILINTQKQRDFWAPYFQPLKLAGKDDQRCSWDMLLTRVNSWVPVIWPVLLGATGCCWRSTWECRSRNCGEPCHSKVALLRGRCESCQNSALGWRPSTVD